MSSKKTLFQYVGKTRILPISTTILAVFICLILLSNFMTNFISLQLSQRQIINLTNTVLVDQLKELYTDSGNQYQLAQFFNDSEASFKILRDNAARNFALPHSVAMGIDKEGTLLFYVNADKNVALDDSARKSLANQLSENYSKGTTEGSIRFYTTVGEYFGVYKYQSEWQCFLVRAELRKDTQRDTYRVLGIIALVIFILTIAFMIVGIVMFNHIFASIRKINESLYKMQAESRLSTIDISKAPNNDITYLAASFNSLSTSISTLLNIFQKFVSKDVAEKAYSDHTITLEGNQRELTILFSDIKSFTYRTEMLGNEIIDVLNVHYNRVIHKVHENSGVVGSIIGDAILAIFGTQKKGSTKSVDAVAAAWEITDVTAGLREKMIERRTEIEIVRHLTEAEERVYKAVMIDVGVGIDGGNVFYGNIGSSEHMANTVIGDNVNSASRLEGLTRIYHLPVIVSEYIKKETESETSRYHFYELDTVQVKGKTEGKKIFFPFDIEKSDTMDEQRFKIYENALHAYYEGDWTTARTFCGECGLDVAKVLLDRMGQNNAPAGWNGIWTMTTK